MPSRRTFLLALLAFAAAAPAASASSVSVSVPAQAPNYWEAVPFTVDGVADQAGKVYLTIIGAKEQCDSPYPSGEVTRGGTVVDVGSGAFHQAGQFMAPVYNRPSPSPQDRQLPGKFKICAALRPASFTYQQYPVPTPLAVGQTDVVIGPDCLSGAPKLTARAVPGRLGTIELSGSVPWQATTLSVDRGPDVAIGPGAFSTRVSIPADAVKMLKRGMQSWAYGPMLWYKQRCVAPDGATAPAPGNVLDVSTGVTGRISRDGSIITEDEIPPPTFAGAVAIGKIQTTPVAFPKPVGPGMFEREVRVIPVGSKRPALIAKGHQTGMGIMEIKLTPNAGKILGALGKKVFRTKLRLETTFTPNGGKTRSLPDSTMLIVRR